MSAMDTKKAIDELKRLMEPESGQDDVKPVPPPLLADVLYVEPAPGGERRACKNCFMFQPLLEQCVIHSSSVEITEEHICGYHVLGQPSKQWKDIKGLQAVNPKFSGLVLTKDGSACENCQYFTSIDEEEGVCAAVFKKEKLKAHVHPKGCCTRWTKKGLVTDPKDK